MRDIHLPSVRSMNKSLGRLLDEGMSVTRLNFSHGDHALHEHTLQNLRAAVRKRPGCHCAVLLDTKGPEIRTGLLENGIPVQLLVGVAIGVRAMIEWVGYFA